MNVCILRTSSNQGLTKYLLNHLECLYLTYLKQPRPQLPIYHYIKAKNFKANTITAWRHTRTAHPVRMEDMRLSYKQSANNHVRNVAPQQAAIYITAAEVLVEVTYGPLAACVVCCIFVIEFALLVDWVVCQVHKEVVLE